MGARAASLDGTFAGWVELDLAGALHPIDRSAVRATEPTRSLVLDLLRGTSASRDLFNACARLGALMAEAGASPSVVAGTIDNAAIALGGAGITVDASRLAAARASAIEGYVAATVAGERQAAASAWDYPACAVELGDDSIAIACGHPSADDDALADWAARLAGTLVKKKIRKVKLAGSDRAVSEAESALELVGIEVTAERTNLDRGPRPSPPSGAKPSWLSRLWRK